MAKKPKGCEAVDPLGRIGPMGEPVEGVCQLCGCTANDCRVCIERRGEPCTWVNADRTLCSACTTTVLEEAANALRAAADFEPPRRTRRRK